jgi:preprotein translocase subunit SecA
MSLINSILKAFVGDKSQKDVKALQPLVNKIKSYEGALAQLSHDELREKTLYFKDTIKKARADKDAKIASYLEEIENTKDIDAREDIYASIDALEKEAYEITEKTLLEILPEAFAVVKETARRFKENSSVTVTATAKDREFSAAIHYYRRRQCHMGQPVECCR